MCYSAKASLIGFWLIAIVAFFLWYRNEYYDRVLATFLLVLSLIQLVEYGVHSGMNGEQGGRMIYVTLWLQCLVLAVGVYVYVSNSSWGVQLVATGYLIAFTLIFLITLLYALFGSSSFCARVGPSGHVEWTNNGGFLLGSWGWLYLLGIFGALFLLLASQHWSDTGLLILILYGVLSAIFVALAFPPQAFGSLWCYLAVGFAFLAWFLGILWCPPTTS